MRLPHLKRCALRECHALKARLKHSLKKNSLKKNKLKKNNLKRWAQARVSAALFLSVSLVSACTPPSSSQSPSPSPPARLQAVRVLKRPQLSEREALIALTDVAYHEGRWGEGRVLFIDAQTGELLGAHYTEAVNPQALVSFEEPYVGLLVVQGGPLELGSSPQGGRAALSWHPAEAPLSRVSTQALLSAPLSEGYPINAARSPQQAPLHEPLELGEPPRALDLSSGVSALLWRVEPEWRALGAPLDEPLDEPSPASGELRALSALPLRYAPQGELSLSEPLLWGEHTLTVDFNSDRLYFFDALGQLTPCAPHVGRFEDVMEGAQTPRLEGDRLWLTFGLSGELIELNLAALNLNDPLCELERLTYTPPLGAVPNDLTLTASDLYVVHSGEQDVWRYSRVDRARLARFALPDDTHPWQATLAPPREPEEPSRLLVTGWLSGALLELTLEEEASGERLGVARELSPPALLSAPSPMGCARPREVFEEPLPLNDQALILTWRELSSASQRATEVNASALQGAPQLALMFEGEGEVNVEVQLEDQDLWRPLTTLTLRSSSALNALNTGEAPQLLNAHELHLTSAHAQEHHTLSTGACELFEPQEGRVRLALTYALEQLTAPLPPSHLSPSSRVPTARWLTGDPRAGRVKLNALKLTARPLNGSTTSSLSLRAVSYRAW